MKNKRQLIPILSENLAREIYVVTVQPACPVRPVAPGDGTGVGLADRTGMNPHSGTPKGSIQLGRSVLVRRYFYPPFFWRDG
jgi:hypothetical protein